MHAFCHCHDKIVGRWRHTVVIDEAADRDTTRCLEAAAVGNSGHESATPLLVEERGYSVDHVRRQLAARCKAGPIEGSPGCGVIGSELQRADREAQRRYYLEDDPNKLSFRACKVVDVKNGVEVTEVIVVVVVDVVVDVDVEVVEGVEVVDVADVGKVVVGTGGQFGPQSKMTFWPMAFCRTSRASVELMMPL